MAMKFKSQDHIGGALNSEIRWKSKEKSKKLFEMYKEIVIHTVFTTNHFDPFYNDN